MSIDDFLRDYDPIAYKAKKLKEVRETLVYDDWAVYYLIYGLDALSLEDE